MPNANKTAECNAEALIIRRRSRTTTRSTARALPWLVLAALLGCPVRSYADDLPALIQKYVAWRGGAAFDQLRSVYMHGSLETAGLHGTEALWVDRAGHQRVDSDLGVLKQTQVVAPGQAWDTTASGQVETMAASDVRSLSRDEALQLPDAIRGRGEAKTTLRGVQKRGGREWAVIRVTFGDKDTYDVLINAKTGELGGFDIVEDRQSRFEGFSDWRMVDGVRMPFLQTVKTEAPGGDQVVRVAAMELNQPISPDRLARPGPIHKAAFEKGTTSTGWINFDFFQSDRIFLPAEVDGRATVVLLDSGATVSAIDKGFASALGLVPKGGFTAPGTGGIDTTGFVGGVDVRIGSLTLKHLNAAAFDFQPIATRIGHAMPFVLGDEVFNELAVDIDFAHHRLAFRDPASIDIPAGAVSVPLSRIFGNRSVPVGIDGGPAVPFEFDLGNGGPPDIYAAYSQAHPLLQAGRTSQVLGGGVGGYHPTMIVSLGKLEFAKVEFHNVPATLASDTLSGSNSNVVVGNVGLSILSRFHLVIDYSHDRLYALPYADAGTAPFDKDRLGMSLKRAADAIEVEFVSPGSPAQAAGLKAGDKIKAIDGKQAKDWPGATLAALRYRRAGDTLEITLNSGDLRKLVLADFF